MVVALSDNGTRLAGVAGLLIPLSLGGGLCPGFRVAFVVATCSIVFVDSHFCLVLEKVHNGPKVDRPDP